MLVIEFPYQENQVDGFFARGVRKGILKNYCEVKLSSVYASVYDAIMCFDGDSQTFCHTRNENTNQYLQIRFKRSKFKLQGFAIQNRSGNFWDVLNYIIQGSNDGQDFDTLGTFNENSSDVCISSKKRTNRIGTENMYEYIRLQSTGHPCNKNGSEREFNIAEFDLYGTFYKVIITYAINRRIYLSLELLIILLCSS